MEGFNTTEKGPEKTFSKEEVMGIIRHFGENAKVTEEINDEQGLLFRLSAETGGENPGDINVYEYMRKGRIDGGGGGSKKTSIEVVYYHDGAPISGETVADYNEETGEWTYFQPSH